MIGAVTSALAVTTVDLVRVRLATTFLAEWSRRRLGDEALAESWS